MTVKVPVDALARQDWLKRADGMLQRAVTKVLSPTTPTRQRINDVLNGIWLGHPLHPSLTDVPIGAWTAAFVLDLLEAFGRREIARGADAAVAIGLAAVAPTAASGMADWQHLAGRASRLGVAHALFNVSASLAYAGSLACRGLGLRGAGRVLAYLGYGLVLGGAWLGGHLVYVERSGVDHADKEGLPRNFTPVMPLEALAERTPHRAMAGDKPILLYRNGDRIYALAETCAHLGGPLAEGKIVDGSVVCPWHGSRFALEDGRVLNGPSAFPQPVLETRVRDGQIEVRAAR